MQIRVVDFLGIAPKIAPTDIAVEQAQIAQDSKVYSGSLKSFFGLGNPQVLSKPTGLIKTIFSFNNDTVFLCWTQDVDAVRGPIAGDTLEKTYFTGTDKPRVTTNDIYNAGSPGTNIPPASYILGIPAPIGPPVASDVGAGNITVTSSTWIYTFVRKWSDGTTDESGPSPASNALGPLTSRQVSVTLPNGAITTADYGITHKRLYRQNGSLYFFVSEVAIGTSPTTDNLATASLGSAITTLLYLPPPDSMIGLIALPNGIMAGFSGNTVYLSEPYRPHAYPQANQYTVNWPIVALGGIGTAVVVATTAYPSIGRGVDPAAYSFTRSLARYPCVSKRSMASADFGVIWAMPYGLAMSDGATVVNATKDFLSQVDWNAQFFPSTIHAKIHEGRYHGWFTNGSVDANGFPLGSGFILDMREKAYLITTTPYFSAAGSMYGADRLFGVKQNPLSGNQNSVYEWEGNASTRFTFDWKSKKFLAPGFDNLGWGAIFADYGSGLTPAQIAQLQAQIAMIIAFNAAAGATDGPLNGFVLNGGLLDGDNVLQTPPSANFIVGNVTFKYYLDGLLVATKTIGDSNPFPLPAGISGHYHEIELGGSVEVFSLAVASTVEELAFQQ